MTASSQPTHTVTHVKPHSAEVPSLRVTVTPHGGAPAQAPLGMAGLVVGAGADCDLVVDDPLVSRRHCEISVNESGILLRDLGSKNGTRIGDVVIREALVAPGVLVTIGSSELRVSVAGEPQETPLSVEARFGDALGASLVMRQLFDRLKKAAATDATILLLGESGTGKELLARAIHEHSARKGGPFAVLDCSVADALLLSDELFGHEKGAFTDAKTAKKGVLAEADGGTLFIDEVGELPLDLQPKLLRALEERKYRALGSTSWTSFDARVIAATHRSLRGRAATSEFRQDLYYRLAVIEAKVPPLRERRDDIPLLVRRMLADSGARAAIGDDVMSMLAFHAWPGNVRELRNIVTRLILFPDAAGELAGDMTEQPRGGDVDLRGLLGLPLSDARKAVVASFEKAYVEAVLRAEGGNVTRAADRMRISRTRLYELFEQHGITRRTDDASSE